MGTFVPFGEWLPDLPNFQNPGATVAKNVIPDIRSYRPFPSQSVYSTSLGSQCRGLGVARDSGGTYYDYAGDASALYVLTSLSWSNVSRTVGGAYTMADDEFWEFTQFGQLVIGVNGLGDDPQAITAGAANFAALGGSPPRARHIASIRDFVMLGNLSGSPQSVRWCAINNAASWTADAATLADSQDLPGNSGWVQKVVGGEYGTIFQERAIYRATFVGSPLIFQFDKVHTNIGALAPQAVINHRNFIFFLSEDGFCMFDGSEIYPIGEGKVNRTFFNELDSTYVYRTVAAIDPVRKLVAWAYTASGNSGGNPNRILIYHWPSRRWSRIEDLNIEFIARTVTGAYTLDTLDNFSSNLDAIMLTLDSTQWSGGNYLFSCFDSSHRLNHFNGSAMAATVETTEIQLAAGAGDDPLATVNQLRPIAEGLSASFQAAVGSRLNLTQSVSYSSAMSPVSAGFVEVRNTNRFHRFRLTTASATDFTHVQGFDVAATVAGER